MQFMKSSVLIKKLNVINAIKLFKEKIKKLIIKTYVIKMSLLIVKSKNNKK